MPGRLRVDLEAPHRVGMPTGEQVQGAALELLRRADPALAAALHDGGTPPLYHCAALPGRGPDRLGVQVGLLRDGDLERALAGWLRQPPREVFLGPQRMGVAAILAAGEEDPETGAVPLAALGAEADGADGVTLRFLTPTLFRSPSQGPGGARPVRAWPTPERVLDSLARRLRRAQEEAGEAAPADVGWAQQAAAFVSELGGGGEIVDAPSQRHVRGFVGEVRWSFGKGLDNGARRLMMQALALAPYIGVGSRSAQGCGHVRLRWHRPRQGADL